MGNGNEPKTRRPPACAAPAGRHRARAAEPQSERLAASKPLDDAAAPQRCAGVGGAMGGVIGGLIGALIGCCLCLQHLHH